MVAIENAALRQQLALFKQKRPKPRLRGADADRAFWELLRPWWLLRPIRLLFPRVNRVMPQSDNHDEAPRAPEAQRLEHSERVICAQTAREHVARYLDADAPC